MYWMRETYSEKLASIDEMWEESHNWDQFIEMLNTQSDEEIVADFERWCEENGGPALWCPEHEGWACCDEACGERVKEWVDMVKYIYGQVIEWDLSGEKYSVEEDGEVEVRYPTLAKLMKERYLFATQICAVTGIKSFSSVTDCINGRTKRAFSINEMAKIHTLFSDVPMRTLFDLDDEEWEKLRAEAFYITHAFR